MVGENVAPRRESGRQADERALNPRLVQNADCHPGIHHHHFIFLKALLDVFAHPLPQTVLARVCGMDPFKSPWQGHPLPIQFTSFPADAKNHRRQSPIGRRVIVLAWASFQRWTPKHRDVHRHRNTKSALFKSYEHERRQNTVMSTVTGTYPS